MAELGGEAQRSVAGRVGAPERKVVTVMFVDVSGFTALSETLDAEVVRELMNSCFDSLVPVIERYGGVIDKFIGDEMMALFGAPQATEHHADHALRACLDCFFAIGDFNDRNDTALSLHIGVNSGLVVAGGVGSTGRQDYSVRGDTVNVAARLEGASETGEILVGPATFRLTAESFEFEALAPIALKGKTQPMPVYRLLGPKLHRTSAGEASERLALSHVGRDGELRTLLERAQNVTDRCVSGIRTASGNVVAITGDAGIGKSRMLSEFRRHLGRFDGLAGGRRAVPPQRIQPCSVPGPL